MDVCPAAKDRAITSRVMRSTPPPMEDINPAFPYGAPGDENDNPANAVRAIKAGRANNMAIHI